jgi:hypothetical protein
MAGRTFAPIARSACAVAAVMLAACGGSGTQADGPASHEMNPVRAPRVSGPCPATSPNGKSPASSDGFNHGNRSLAVALWPKGRLVAGPLPDGGSYAEIKPDGSIVAKLGWWRGVEGPLTIRGERLDGSSAPLRAAVPQSGYGSTGFLPSLLMFPTQGCWKVVGSIGRANLTFVVLVRKR